MNNTREFTYGSVCSGIEAASVAWHTLGWTPAWFSEIDMFANAVLAHHYPTVANLGDMTKLSQRILNHETPAPDLLCGGTPCQAFSVAGLRQSLQDDRGNLSLVFCEVADAIDTVRSDDGRKPAIIFWENVPGVLTTRDNAFGCFLAGIVGEEEPLTAPRDKWPNAGIVVGPKRTAVWRVLDAQHFGLAQRRKRVFVVASARDDIDVGQVLFELDGVQRDTPPGRNTRKADTTTAETSVAGDRRNVIGYQNVSPTLRAEQKQSLMSGSGQINAPLAINFQYSADVAPTITSSGPPFSRTGNQHQELDAYVATGHTGTDIPHAMAFKVRGEGTYTGENGGRIINTNQFGGAGMLTYDEKTFTLSTAQDQFVAYTMREDATNNTFSINETDVSLTLQSAQPTINSHHAQMLIQELAMPNNTVVAYTMREDETDNSFTIKETDVSLTILARQPALNGHHAQMLVQEITADEPPTAYGINVDQHRGMTFAPEIAHTLLTTTNEGVAYADQQKTNAAQMRVRRLTPVECERLQGFPDNYTLITYRNAPANDSARYRVLGNSWAVPVVRWIGTRIQQLIDSAE